MSPRRKKLERGIGKCDFKGLIIDRSKTREGVNTQIDVSADLFQKLDFLRKNAEQSYDGEEDVLPTEEAIGNPLPERRASDISERAERPKMKRRGKALRLEVELDLSEEFPMEIC